MLAEIRAKYRISICIIAILDTIISIRVLQVIAPGGIIQIQEGVEQYVAWIFNACYLSLSLIAPCVLLCSSLHRTLIRKALAQAKFWLVYRCVCTIINVFGLMSHGSWVELAIYSPMWFCSLVIVALYIKHLNRIIVQGIFNDYGADILAMAVLRGGMELSNDREKKLMQIFTIQQP